MNKSVLHLVNQESVIFESVQLARHALARELGLPVGGVSVEFSMEGDKLRPQFNMNPIVLERMSNDEVGETMSKVWSAVKVQMEGRLQNLGLRRHG